MGLLANGILDTRLFYLPLSTKITLHLKHFSSLGRLMNSYRKLSTQSLQVLVVTTAVVVDAGSTGLYKEYEYEAPNYSRTSHG